MLLVLRREDLVDFDDLGEVDDSQQCHLPEGPQRDEFILEQIFEHFDGDDFPCFFVDGFEDVAVRPTADQILLRVPGSELLCSPERLQTWPLHFYNYVLGAWPHQIMLFTSII